MWFLFPNLCVSQFALPAFVQYGIFTKNGLVAIYFAIRLGSVKFFSKYMAVLKNPVYFRRDPLGDRLTINLDSINVQFILLAEFLIFFNLFFGRGSGKNISDFRD